MTDILYKASAHQRHQWNYHKLVTPNAQEAERQGTGRYQSFDTFTGEIYHRMFSDNPKRIEDPAEGTDVFQKLDSCIDEIPELDDLKRRCTGNEHFSGIATTAIIDQLMRAIPAPNETVADPTRDAETLEILKKMLDSAETQEEQEALAAAAQEAQEALAAALAAAQEAADNMDSSDIRNAIRKATKAASEEIQADEELVAALCAGTGMGSGKTEQKMAAAKLRKLVQDNPRMKDIAKLAGRLQRIAADKQREKARSGIGQIDGITLGDSIPRILPSELAYLDGELEDSFNARYVQKGLLNWEVNDKDPKQKGAIVMLLDSSGSMADGYCDQWAAALAMAFLDIAKQQDRAFAIVHFGGDVLRVDQWEAKTDWTSESIIEAVSFFAADGGTSFMAPLDRGIEAIRSQEAFHNADMVMVTDGWARVDSDWLDGFKRAQAELEFNVYSILVGDAADSKQAKSATEKFSNESVALADALKDDKKMHDLFGKV